MNYTVIWSPKAVEDFDAIVYYLKTQWGQKSADNFIDNVEHHIALLQTDIIKFTRSSKHRNIFKAVIHPHTTLNL